MSMARWCCESDLNSFLILELATFEYDLTSLKKSCNQLRSDFKHVSTINLNELKSIKDKCQENERHLKEEQSSKAELRKTVGGLDRTLKAYFEGQTGACNDIKKDLKSMQEFQHHQLTLLKLSLDEMTHDLTDFKVTIITYKYIRHAN